MSKQTLDTVAFSIRAAPVKLYHAVETRGRGRPHDSRPGGRRYLYSDSGVAPGNRFAM